MRIEQLTFTRFLAAISIVIFHYGHKSFLFNNKYVDFIFKQANIGVSYFFLLSGFVMIIAYHKKESIKPVQYLKNRFARIYPIYLFAIILVLLGQVLINNIEVTNLFLNLFLVQSWVPDKALTFNPPGWSLSVELVFYVIFPFLYNHFYKKLNLKKIVICILLFWFVFQVIYNLFINTENHLFRNFLVYNPLMHLNVFFIGNVSGLLFIKYFKDKRKNYNLLILSIIICILLVLNFDFGLNYHNGLLSIFFIPFILLLSINNSRLTKVLNKKVFIFLGEISYGIYILQFPVFSLVSAYSLKKYLNIYDETVLFLIRLVILIILSSITYKFIEKPLQKHIKKKKK